MSDTPREKLESPTIAIVSSSQAKVSRSRMAVRYLETYLQEQQVQITFLDLRDCEIRSYPHSKGDAKLSQMIEQFNAATAWILAVPLYNWGPSAGILNFLHYALDDEVESRYRPFLLVAGAGGVRGHLALDSLARTLIYEVFAVQVGPAIFAAGNLADRDREELDPELESRLRNAGDALAAFARVRMRASLPWNST